VVNFGLLCGMDGLNKFSKDLCWGGVEKSKFYCVNFGVKNYKLNVKGGGDYDEK